MEDEKKVYAEEMFTATLIRGGILSLMDKKEEGKEMLLKIIKNKDFIQKSMDDTFVYPWALYEFGVLLMRSKTSEDLESAKSYFLDARKLARKNDFSFSHML